ncbi:MAG: hypothetical protein WD872_16545 [Pirellulaceae bacterium]
MPATESTWRDSSLLHRTFAIGGVVLTFATVWMFYKDHSRPWKAIQPKAVNIDLKMNQWRQEQFATTDALLEHESLSQAIVAAQAQPLDPDLLAQFERRMQDDAEYRKTTVETEWIDKRAARLAPLSAKAVELRAATKAAFAAAEAKPEDQSLASAAHQAETAALAAEREAGAVRTRLLDDLNDVIAAAKSREDKVLGERKFKSANIDAAKANRDIAIRDNLGAAELARREEAIRLLVEGTGPDDRNSYTALNLRYQAYSAHRKALDKLVQAMTVEADQAQKEYEESLAGLERLKTQYAQQEETYFTLSSEYPWIFGKKILTLPILDAFGSPRKIENQWSEGLEQDYNFRKVRRFDRCTTCHVSMQKSLPGQPTTPAYVAQQTLEMVVYPPPKDAPPKQRIDTEGKPIPLSLEDWLGIRLAPEGLLQADDVTVSLVLPKSPAARAQFTTGEPPIPGQPGEVGQPGHELREAVAQVSLLPRQPDRAFPRLPGLLVGDVIVGINGSPFLGGQRGAEPTGAALVVLAQDGKPIRLTVRRGLPNPYIAHPRLDLFVGDSSPHALQTFACTICHDGQGSATDFKWASHAPNTQDQAREWSHDYGWFDNHHWIYPMYPARFVESACLKCHHEVVDLEPSERFPEPPAPKVVHGYQLIRKYGCYGCHEVNGHDGPNRRIGPDLRLEPNYFAAAQALLPLLPARQAYFDRLAGQASEQPPSTAEEAASAEPAATDPAAAIAQHQENIRQAARLATTLASRPQDDAARHELQAMLDEDVRIASENANKPLAQQAWTTFGPQIQAMAGWFKDQETPGDQRKPGPSLRYLGAKVDRTFLYDWIRDPTNFRPDTRMPKFFGLWDHLKNEQGEMTDHLAAKLEPIEIRGTMEFLLAQSDGQMSPTNAPVEKLVQLYEPLPREPGIDPWTDEEKVARGKTQFQTRGCLACHNHKDFPEIAKYRSPEEIVQGPDLSAVGDKFGAERNPQGPDWLYSWIKEPTRYHARTVMPDLFLDPEKDAGADPLSADDDKWFDPADDIATYLLAASTSDWQPAPEATAANQPLDQAGIEALKQLTLEYLNEAFYKDLADEYYQLGIPPELEEGLKGAEKDLIVPPGEQLTDQQRLQYIGRKTITKYGCYGCHDIPGFEDAKPIGTGLADWGRKDPSRLAFEHITHYLEGHGHAHTTDNGHAAGPSADHGDHGETAAKTAPHDMEHQASEAYYHHQVQAGNRIGFIYQKLKEPRSYDFRKTENKRYNERLRMPQFPFTLEEREAVITFVLGLVADPPREKYIFTPDDRGAALIAGRKALEKYNCGGCHILELEQWNISYAKGDFGPQTPPGQQLPVFPFLRPDASSQALQAQATPDHRNLLHSHLLGLPKLSKTDGLPELTDADGLTLDDAEPYAREELRLAIDLWQPTIIDGEVYATGQSAIGATMQQLDTRQPVWGGALTKYLLPEVTRLERESNPNASGSEAYGWLPPALVGEGEKVQASWLHDFLLEPYPIRPATFLRMPKFNMSSDEATALVNYFAAVDNAKYPYQLSPRRLDSQMAAEARDYAAALEAAGEMPAEGGAWSEQSPSELLARRYDDAMQIVVDGNYCVKCHQVGDFEPQGRDRAKAPNLADVYRRFKPEFLRRWIAQPNMILPYTSMPVNVKYDPALPFEGGVSQELYHGTSTEQVDALVDLLMNYDQYSRQSRKIADMVKPVAVPIEGAPAEGAPAGDAPAEAAPATEAPAATGSSGE